MCKKGTRKRMKKKKTPISNNLLRQCSELRRQRDAIMMASDYEKLHSRQCEKYPPCIVCGKEGDNIRKCFFPMDWEPQMKAFGHTFAMAICPECLNKKIDEDQVFEMFHINDLKIVK